MKNLIIKYLKTAHFLMIIGLIVFVTSCQLLEVEENFDTINENNSIPKIEVSFGESTNFNLSSTEGAFIDLIFQSNQTFNANIEIYAALNSTDSTALLVSTVETVPTEIELEIDVVKLAFQDQNAELENGDSLFFSFRSTTNGESYQFNNTALATSVTCNSEISTADDIWTGTAITDNGASFPATATAENITIIPIGDDSYVISDISAGWFEAIGFRAIQEGIYQDDCNQISWVGPGENIQFNFAAPELDGTWDPQSQTLTVYWSEPGNEFSGQSVFTKN